MIYLIVGCVAGVLAGLLGIGGGLVIVPMMVYCLALQGVSHDCIMHLSLGTSMASIVFTSVSSFLAHHKKKAVNWSAVRRIVIGILIGSFLGSCIASYMPTNILKVFFVIFLIYASIQIYSNHKPKPSRKLPGRFGMFVAGNTIGSVSSLIGIGGGTLSVPFMVWCNIPMHTAIGTAAAIGFPIAIAGTVGYVYNGMHATGLPAYSVGYVYLPALGCILCRPVR